eukprot:scaffold1618_cov397-Prasinococcus_capsulatus_cf.AAC.18
MARYANSSVAASRALNNASDALLVSNGCGRGPVQPAKVRPDARQLQRATMHPRADYSTSYCDNIGVGPPILEQTEY